MALEAIGGKIQSEPLNRNFSYLDSRLVQVESTLEETATKKDLTDLRNEIFTQKQPLSFTILPAFASGETIYNASSFIQDNITTFGDTQYCVFTDENRHPIVCKRTLPDGEWSYYDLFDVLGSTVLNEHRTYVIAVDNLGYIHIAGNMHATGLKYVRSNSPNNITSWTAATMTGNETVATYPTFVKRKDGKLLFFYRDGVSGNGDMCANLYNEVTKTWTSLGKIIDGKSTNESPYWNHIVVDKDGVIHVSGCFRGTNGADSNNDIWYMKSKDGGITWEKMNGTKYNLPVTHNTIEIIKDTSASGTGMLNQNGMAVDSKGNPHIAYFRYDNNGSTNIFHLYFNGQSWIERKITNFKTRHELAEITYWMPEIARPSLFTVGDRVFIIYRANYGGKKGIPRMIEVTPELDKTIEFPILGFELYHWEPTFDTQALYNRNELHMMIIPCSNTMMPRQGGVADNWNKQLAGVLSIDLNQIDKLVRQEVPLPRLEVKKALSAGGTTKFESEGTHSLESLGVIPIVKQDNILFAKLSVRGRGRKNTKLTVRISHINLKSGPVTNSFNSIVYQETFVSSNRETPWRPLPINSGDGLIQAEAVVEFLNSATSGEADISALSIELAELVFF